MFRKIILLLPIIPLFAYAFNNEPDGFRGYKWEDQFSQHEAELNLVQEAKESKVYTRQNDQLKIGGAEIKEIVYFFNNNQLFSSVMIKSDGFSNKTALTEAFKTQFGTPNQPNRYIETYFWHGGISEIILSCKKINDECTAIIQSKKLSEERRNNAKEAAKNSKSDF